MNQDARRRLEAVFREEHGRIVGGLVRRYGDVELAQDATSEAIETALVRWPVDGVPPNPGGWLATTANRKALDRLRRESGREVKESAATAMLNTDALPLGVIDDDRLRLLFLCTHPAIAFEARVALTLRLVSGLGTAEIARAFLVPDRTVAQRITRARRKIADARIAFRIPEREDLPQRVAGVLAVLYLVFNEGYLATFDPAGTRDDLAVEAIRLTRMLVDLLPAEPEPQGLLALLLITQSRRDARVVGGRLVPLDEQDRNRWDAALLAEGVRRVRALRDIGRPGPYQVQAAIAAAHSTAHPQDVPWSEVVDLYDLLLKLAPSDVVRLNRALALAHVEGPAAGLALVDALHLPNYAAWHAARGHLLEQLGRAEASAAAFERATAETENPLEREHLRRRATRARS